MRRFWTSSLVLAVAVGGLAVVPSATGTAPLGPHAGPGQTALAPPTTVSSRYVVVGDGPVLRVGNTVYAGGVTRLGLPTGSAVAVSTQTGSVQSVKARVSGGSVQAVRPDGAGGWFVGGTFTSVGGVGRPGLAHILADGSLDTAFMPPELGQVRALALDAGRLYVGGIQPLFVAPWFQAVLSALDPATGALLPVSYPVLPHTDESPAFGVIALAAGEGRLFAAFNGDNGLAAYDEGSGALLWSQPGAPSYGRFSGPAAVALAGGRLLAAGQISTFEGPVNLEELDPATGGLLAQPAVDGAVTGMATGPANAYLLVRSPHIFGLTVWKLGLSSGTLTRLFVVKGASAIAVDSPTLYVTSQSAVRGEVRIYAFDTRRANPNPRALPPVLVGGGVGVLALQSGQLLIGGSYLGTGTVPREGLAAFDATTGALLPWHPSVPKGRVAALASSGRTIYLAGAFKRVSGEPRVGLAAVSALGAGKLLSWHARLSQGSFGSLVVARGRVFAGGSAKPHGAKASTRFRHLLVFSARTGRRLRFDSRIGRVHLMALSTGRLLAENDCGSGRVTSACITAFRVGGVGRPVWRRTFDGKVYSLETAASTLYVGGAFSSVDGKPRTNLAALVPRTGKLLDFTPQVEAAVTSVAATDYGLVYGTSAFGPGSRSPYFVGAQALGAISVEGAPLPWEFTFPPNDVPLSTGDTAALAENFAVTQLTAVPGGLVARGNFAWIGPSADPQPGSLVWLR